MKALKSGKSVTWFDFETTGTNIFKGAIPTEIATMTLHPSGKVSNWSTILQTGGRPVSAEGWEIAAKYGGITREMMESGMPLGQAAQKLKDIIGEGMIAGQNIQDFDVPFLEQLFNMTGVEAPGAVADAGRQFDLLQAMRKTHGTKQSQAMSAVERRLKIINPDPHQAMSDTWSTMTAAHRELGYPEAAVPDSVYSRMKGLPAKPSPAVAAGDDIIEQMASMVRPGEKQLLKQTGQEVVEHLKGFGRTLMAAARKHPTVAAGAALLGGAMIVDQMRASRRRTSYNMQVTPAQMSRAYHANRVYV